MNFNDYYDKFEKIQNWINDDLTRSSVRAQANFLVAMGIFNYIEFLGSFYLPDGRPSERFNFAFQNFFTENYSNLFTDLQGVTNTGAYDCLRCGMTHEYLVKTYTSNLELTQINFTIYGVNDQRAFDENIALLDCGLILLPNENNYHLQIFNPRLIYDLNLAFENYKSQLNKVDDYKDRFLRRCETIHLENFN